MATTDIVARLQLRAEQFTSETGRAFAEMKSRAQSSAHEIRSSFTGAFGEVQRLAQTSLRLPRTETGSLNLAPQIAQLTSQANAAEQAALALRELSIAQNSAAASATEGAQALRLEADASAVAALNEERHATELRQKVAALELVQGELNRTASATRLLTVAEEEAALAGRRAGGGFSMAGQQVTDFTVQVMSGQSAALAFAQQLPQLTYSLIGVGGAAGRLGAFFAGPWGTAITLATVVLTPLVAKLWESEEAGNAAASGVDNYVAALKRLREQAGAFKFESKEFADANKTWLDAEAKVARLQLELAKAPAKASYASLTPSGGSAMISTGAPAPAIRDKTLVQKDLDAAILARDMAIIDRNALFKQKSNYEELHRPAPAKGGTRRGKSAASVAARDEYSNDAADKIATMRDQFLDMPPAVRQVQDALREVDNIIRGLNQKQPEGFRETIKLAEELEPLINDALNQPFRDYVKSQRESLAIGRLTLAGRDAEADAMQAALRIQEQQGELSDAQLNKLLRMAEQHQKIAEALEDQRRIVGIYTGMVGDLHSTFRGFLDDLDGNTGSALKGLFSGFAADLKAMQRDLLANAIFGGVERDVEKFVRQMTGRKLPNEILEDEAKATAAALRSNVDGVGDAMADFVTIMRRTSDAIAGTTIAGSSRRSLAGIGGGAFGAVKLMSANDNEDIIVRGRLAEEALLSVVSSSQVVTIALDGLATNFRRMGIDVPKSVLDALNKTMPAVLNGLSYGQLGGSVFASITGGKDNKLASSIGGTLGSIAGKELGKLVPQAATGLLKTLGGAAGPIGSIVGGILGNALGGLFNKPQYGTAILGNATDKVSATGRGSSSIGAASGMAGSVQEGLSRLAEQLGATLGTFDTVVGMFDGKYRVRTTASGWDGKGPLDFKGNSKNNLYDFGEDQQSAIAFAIADAVRDGAIKGLSAASSAILQKSSDLEAAVSKVMLIEAIPRDLKAMLDPVGAAVDDLNRKWLKTKAALEEGGASAEQMAQAQRLYNLQLDQTLSSTPAAAATLKQFRDGLMLGSSSPYGLRDQETAAIGKLAPYLQQIAAGQSIDQERYQAAAEAYLAVERQMYGSTQAYFDALDTVQAATNKAIAAIENVAPITPAVESPFARTTSDNTGATAQAAKTLTEQTDDTNALLARIAARLDQLGVGDLASDFVGAGRGFKATGTY